ncbi:MAG: hemerythrin domain-containing protein [Planctomycetota bacterium]|nr:hemerythrin domain-containing protein [Planctomycetota bacterium]
MAIQIGHQGSPNFHQPLELLSDCHRRIERFLHALVVVSREERGRRLSPAGRQALELASEYFRTAAPLHTADEEQSLFPLVRAHAVGDDRGVAATLDAQESEHRDNEAAHARVEELVARWLRLDAGGLPEAEAAELVSILESLEGIYARHIRVEDEELFPAAQRMLADHELEDVGRAMAERRGLSFQGPIARFLGADHDRLGELLAASLAGDGPVLREPFDAFRAGILRHISMEEKHLIPQAAAALDHQRPAIADLLRVDHSAIATLLLAPPTRELVAELRAILDRHDRCEEQPGGLYDLCDRALGAEAALRLVAEMDQHPPVALKPYSTSARIVRHMAESVERSSEAWRRWQQAPGKSDGLGG